MRRYGLTDRYAALAAQYPQWTPVRVAAQERGLYRVISPEGEFTAAVSGKFEHLAEAASDFPCVGDFVMAELSGGHAVIHEILPRKSVFMRKAAGTGRREQLIAANIDTAFICMSLNNDFSLRRLERYVSIAWDSGATPVVVLTKADLCPDLASKLGAVSEVAFGVDILAVTAMEEDGYAQLQKYLLPGRTAALIGSSGVGKSTLINRLLGEERLLTNGLRGDDKGRHTTTRRELFMLPCGAMMIDTPGMRELGMWGSDAGVEQTFADIEALAAQCRFADCRHGVEPGCAVRRALQSGELDEGRWQSYLRLSAENAYAQDSEDYLAAKEKKFKEIAMFNKKNKKR